MNSKGIFLVTILVLLIILIITMSYLNYKKYINKENFNDEHEIYDTILNIKRLLEDTSLRFDCSLKKYTYPFSNEGNDYFKYISDYTFSKNSNIEELEFKNQLLRSIHSKSFYGLEKLKSLDLSGNNDLRLIGSDVFKNNLGGQMDLLENKEFILTTPFERNTLEQVTLRDKIMIVVYPETLFRIATVHNEIYENTQTPTFTDSISSSSTDSSWSISNDLNTVDDVRDMIIYNYIYEVIPSLESSPEKYKTVVLDLLGVNINIINQNKFTISRKTRGQNKENREELTDQDYVNNFRIVYFKDIFFETDLAYFRTKYYNLRKNTFPHQYTSLVPDIILKYTKAVTVNGVSVRKSLIEIFEEIIVRDNYLKYIVSQKGYSAGFYKNKSISDDYNDSLKEIIHQAQYDAQFDSNQIFIPQNICELFHKIIMYPNTCEYDNGSNCIEKTGVLDVNGNRVIPKNIQTFPVIDVNLTPPFDLLNEDAQCNISDEIIQGNLEEFQSGNGNDYCQANYETKLGEPICCGHDDKLVNSFNVCNESNPYCIFNETPSEIFNLDNQNTGGMCVNLDEIYNQLEMFINLKSEYPNMEVYINFYIDIFNKIIEIDELKNSSESNILNKDKLLELNNQLNQLYQELNNYINQLSIIDSQQMSHSLSNPSRQCPCYAYKYNFNIGGREVERVMLTDINPVIDNFYLLYRLTKLEQMTYLLKYIKILRSLDTSLNVNNIDNLYEKQIVMLSNNFYNIPTQVLYINNQQD